MNYIYKRNFVVRFISFICIVVIFCMSPCIKYIDASCIDTVYATGAEIPVAVGAEAALEYLIAFLATVAMGEAAYENRDALAESYMEYVDIKVENDQLTQDTCMMIYDKTTNAVKNIPWEDFKEDLKNAHDISVDKLTGVYAKYCPQLLGSMKDFVTDVLSGDVYVEGLSDAFVENDFVTASDIEKQWSGLSYALSGFQVHENWIYYYGSYNNYSAPVAATFNDAVLHYYIYDSSQDTRCRIVSSVAADYVYTDGSGRAPGYVPAVNNGYILSFSANVPVFSSYRALTEYFKTGLGYEDAMNFGISMDDAITDLSAVPPFTKPWQEEFWDRVINVPDVGIGSIGAGVGLDDWVTDIPWVGLDSLWDYVTSLEDAYAMVIEDVITGVYDPTKDIPDSYAGAWEDAVDDTWVDVMDIPLELPGVANPDIPVDPDIPIDIPVDSVIDIPIEDIVPTVNDSFADIAAALKYKFPFSIPWDIHHIFSVLADTPKAPYFELPLVIERYGINEKIVIDMSRFQVLSNLSRSMFSMLFAIFLINLTFKVVAMRKEE